MKHTRTPSLLAATFATVLLFSAGHVLADNPPNEPEENAQNDSSQPVTDTWITTKVKADLLAHPLGGPAALPATDASALRVA